MVLLPNEPTIVATSASVPIVNVCKLSRSAYPPAPLLWPPGRAADGAMSMAKTACRHLADT